MTSSGRKPTFIGIFTNYEILVPTYQQRELLHTLLFFYAVSLFSTIKTIQNKKFNNTIVTYVPTMKVMTKTITTIVTKNGQM